MFPAEIELVDGVCHVEFVRGMALHLCLHVVVVVCVVADVEVTRNLLYCE